MDSCWQFNTLRGESLFLVREPDELLTARLLFALFQLLWVKSATRETVYAEVRDFVVNREGKTLFCRQIRGFPLKPPPLRHSEGVSATEESRVAGDSSVT